MNSLGSAIAPERKDRGREASRKRLGVKAPPKAKAQPPRNGVSKPELQAVWRCKCGYWVPRISTDIPCCPYCSKGETSGGPVLMGESVRAEPQPDW